MGARPRAENRSNMAASDSRHYTGWDIGGAHLKVAWVDEQGGLAGAGQLATPLWEGLEALEEAVPRLLALAPAGAGVHGLTMTGELVDCFPGRQQGVRRIVERMAARLGGEVYVYAGPRGMIGPEQAEACFAEVASANWHGAAAVAAAGAGSGILVDIGTTTTDIIPFSDGRVCQRGYSDQERLRTGELVWTGVVRTPVMAVVERVPWEGLWQSVAAERFATMADVYRLTGELDEALDQFPAADGGGKTRYDSLRRLARMLGADGDGGSTSPWVALARHIAAKQFEKLDRAFAGVKAGAAGANRIVAAGAGRFVIEKLARKHDCETLAFEALLPGGKGAAGRAANCATAAATAWLLRAALVPGT